nr:hypothetical protein [Tanacetum cinerariifolium]
MATTIEQQVAMDEALVPSTQRLRIDRSNFLLLSDIESKESTLQLVYDVLRRCPFFKAFLVTADVPKIYMNMLYICPRVQGQTFAKLPFEEEILDFIKFLRHSATIRTLTDIYKGHHTSLHVKGSVHPKEKQGELALCQGQLLVLNDQAPKPKASARRKRSGSDTSITPPTATTTPKPIVAVTPRLTAAAKGKQTTKSLSAPSEFGGSGTDEGTSSKPGVPDVPTDESKEELSWNSSNDKGADNQEKVGDDDEGDEGDKSDEGEEDFDEDKDSDERDDDEENQEAAKYDKQDDAKGGGDDEDEGECDEEDDNEETREEESFDPIPKTYEGDEDEGDGEEDQGLNIGKEERLNEEEEADELYRYVDINQGRGLQVNQEVEDSHVTLTLINSDGQQESSSVSSQFVTNMLNPTSDAGMESIFTTALTSIATLPLTAPTMTPSIVATITTTSQAPIPPTSIPSEVLQNLLTFDSVFRIDDRLRSLEQNFSKVMQTTQFAGAVSAIHGIVQHFMDQRMNEAVQVVIRLQSDRLHEEAQKENDEFLKTIDENIKKIIKEQVKDQVKAQVSKILPRIEQAVNEQLEAKVLSRSSYSSRTSYVVAADLSEMELKKIIIEKMEGNKEDMMMMKTRMKNPSLDQTGGKRDADKLRVDTLTPELLTGHTFELMKGSCKCLIELEYQLEEVYKAKTDQLDWVNPNGQHYPHNLLQPLPLTSDNRGRRVIPFAHFINNDIEYLWGGAFSRKYTTSVTKTKAADYGQIKWIEDLMPRMMWIQEPIDYDKHALWGVSHWGRKREQFYGIVVNQESARNEYSKRRIIAIRDLKIMEWHSYKHLDWITIRHDDDKLHNFKEGNFKRLHLQDIKDMLLLLVQGKLTNLIIEECFAFNVSLRMFTRSIIIQRHVEDLQLGVKSYQKRLNLTKPGTYWSDLKRREAYTSYSNPRGFIYQNKDKKNRLMRIDELYKFSYGTLNDVRTALDDRLKGIRMQYLP